jgi:hypothetical protein
MADPPETSQQAIWVVGVRESADRAFWDRSKVDREAVGVDTLRDRLSEFVQAMHSVISQVEGKVGDWSLDELEVSAEIGAKGSVNLLGTGGEVSAGGGLTLTFRRADT